MPMGASMVTLYGISPWEYRECRCSHLHRHSRLKGGKVGHGEEGIFEKKKKICSAIQNYVDSDGNDYNRRQALQLPQAL